MRENRTHPLKSLQQIFNAVLSILRYLHFHLSQPIRELLISVSESYPFIKLVCDSLLTLTDLMVNLIELFGEKYDAFMEDRHIIWTHWWAQLTLSLVQDLQFTFSVAETILSLLYSKGVEVKKYKLKRRLSSGKRWKIICERYHSYYASVEEHQIRHVPWKEWLFKCLHILNMSCNIVKIQGRIFTPRVRVVSSPIYIFLCTVIVTLPRLFLIILMIPEPCNTHKF